MKKGAVAKPIPIGQPVPLVAADLERLKQPRYVASTPTKLRDSHHMIARLAASGLRGFQIAERVGYSQVRVRDLLASPAMEELIATYRAKVDESFVESVDTFFEVATRNMLAAERHISDHIDALDEAGELLPVRTALAISRDAADRFGYGKKSQQTNINVDFASALEKAIARSGKQIEGSSPLATSSRPMAPPLPRSEAKRVPPSAASPPPLLRRRA